MQFIDSVHSELADLRMRAETTQSTKPVSKLGDVGLPVLRSRNSSSIQTKVKQRSIQRLIVHLPMWMRTDPEPWNETRT